MLNSIFREIQTRNIKSIAHVHTDINVEAAGAIHWRALLQIALRTYTWWKPSQDGYCILERGYACTTRSDISSTDSIAHAVSAKQEHTKNPKKIRRVVMPPTMSVIIVG